MDKKILQSDLRCEPVQKQVFENTNPGANVNDFAPRNKPGEHLRKDGVLYVNDICYGNKYPNSHLDIWYENEDKTVKRPTIFYIHGGGFIFGDKVAGDPLAVSTGREVAFCAEVARKGYNVISPNYALAPEYRFPVQLEQVDQMLYYLTEHQKELGLDMDRVFLGGASAGADLTEMYGVALCNPKYAKEIGINPSIRKSQIKGLLIDEASLNVEHYEEAMNAMLGCWLGVDEPSKHRVANILNAAKWIEDIFFPSFIISSNQNVFFWDSAKELSDILEKNGTEHEFFYRGPELDLLNHGFLQLFRSNQYARECFEHMNAFIERML